MPDIAVNNFRSRDARLAVKVALLRDGMQLTPRARHEIAARNRGAVGQSDYPTTTGITMRLPGDTYVTAPVREAARWTLDLADDTLELSNGETAIPAEALPLPTFYVPKGSSLDGVMTHADRIRLSPVDGCAYGCAFCDSHISSYRKRPTESLLQAFRAAQADDGLRPRHVLISGGTPRPTDRDYLNNVFKTVLSESPLPVDIMLAPAGDLDTLRRLHEWGASGIAINIELFNPLYAERYCPEKAALGLAAYEAWIRLAVDLFGPGRVRSLLLLGLEPLDSTLAGVEFIAALGADPVLSPLQPIVGMPEHSEVPPCESLSETFNTASRITAAAGVKLGPRCIPCQHNALVIPDGSSDYYCS